jgi:adenylate kinase family enzyme
MYEHDMRQQQPKPTEENDMQTTQKTATAKRTQFQIARACAVPILAIETPDPAATMAAMVRQMNGKADTCPVIVHDIVNGLRAWIDPVTGRANAAGEMYIQENAPEPALTQNPVECLALLARKPAPRALCFVLGAQRILQDGGQGWNAGVVQAIWNCRDQFKASGIGATLVLLGASVPLPPELQRDVVIIEEPLPNAEELGRVVDSICADADMAKPEGAERKRVLDCVRGLAAFEAEQVFSMSLDKAEPGGINFPALWRRKVQAIQATKGLSVYQGAELIEDVAGLGNAKRLYSDTLSGSLDCSCIVFLDEIDKAMSASGSDSSGTTQDQNKVLLSYMQDTDILGTLLLGPPGTGKTLLAKALANTFKLPLILVDLGDVKSRYVGDSEANMRAMIKVIHAISGGRALFIGACNRDPNLLPELRRRFSYQLIYVDLPDAQERAGAWKIHTERLRFRGQRLSVPAELADWQKVNADGWTGAEIRNCCLKAYAMRVPLTEAAKSIVPVSKSAGDQIEAARKAASGKYISASQPGLYVYRAAGQAVGRAMGGQ